VWSEKDAKREPESGNLVGQIVYAPLMGKLKYRHQLEESGQGHCRVYDLTREWMNAAMFYPFGPNRDLIDASRRITNMNAAALTASETLAVASAALNANAPPWPPARE
jgi:hypothetical protein